jgi:ferredoxin
MGHLGVSKHEVFKALADRLNHNPIGAPLNETLMRILHIMYTEKEASIGASFPQGFTKVQKLAQLTGLQEQELLCHLDAMAAKGLVMDIPRKENKLYMLTPLVIGFFEYTFMRVTPTLPMQELAELFERYHHEKGVAQELFGGHTKLFQTWVYESMMPEDVETEVLPYEKASAMIRDAGGGSLTMCYCRHQARHRGTACSAPVEDVCMSLGNASEWLVRRGFARPASTEELLHVLDQTEKLGLVHLADNVQKNPAYICHCCGCCCGVLRSINEHQVSAAHPSNFIPEVHLHICTGCGLCVKRCHIHAITVIPSPLGEHAFVQADRCIGCGACIRACPHSALTLLQRQDLHVPPRDKTDQMLRIAKEKGRA